MTGHGPDPVERLQMGARVVVRHRLPRPDPATGATLTDVVGELLALDADTVTVRSAAGPVPVPRSSVTAARVIPPKPRRRGAPHRVLDTDDLQRIMTDAWPPLEWEWLDGWLLRAAGGFTGRANSLLALGNPDRLLDRAVMDAEAWYAARDLPCAVVVAGPVGFAVTDDPLGRLLLDRGYTEHTPTLTLTAATRDASEGAGPLTARGSRMVGGVEVLLGDRLDDEWYAAYTAYRPAPRELVRDVLEGSPDQRFARVTEGSEVVGIGRLGLAHAWGGVAAMWVHPDHRRRGLARAMLTALAAETHDTGARSLHLQVEQTNEPALTLYRALGFGEHHAYVYLRAPGSCRPE